MAASETAEQKPLWLLIEENLLALDAKNLSGDSLEASIQQVAGELDKTGYNVSGHGGNMIKLRFAVEDMRQAGKPFMQDFNRAVEAFSLQDLDDPFAATNNLISNISKTWPKLKEAARRTDVIQIIEKKKLDLLVAKAKEMPGDEGIRLLIGEEVAADTIVSAMEITDEKLAEVNAAIAAERAERERVATLLEAVEGKTDEERVKHLFENNVSEELIMEMAKVDQAALDGAKKAMEEELKEKQRLAEEEAARKKAEAEGPSLDQIPADELIDYIDSVREIMEFSDVEKEIRVMCDQSSIPKALVDIAVSDPDQLDELEKKAEG